LNDVGGGPTLEDMQPDADISIIREIMNEFADLTGLSPTARLPRRYLWTDAFAVCNLLEIYRQTRDDQYLDSALRLVGQVHHILGRHREDDPRSGWISGLPEKEGKRHPTQGGLRIGKKMNERKPTDPFDERLEWDRDGQYYHYLAKWMHALDRVSRVSGDPAYLRWAMELAKTAHARFTYRTAPGGPKRMHWKMSIDLSYPLVPAMGQHDPLDGFITYNQLQAAAARFSEVSAWPDLETEIEEMATICEGKSWATDDPLGIGGLLSDACKSAQLIIQVHFERSDLPEILLEAALLGLESVVRKNHLNLPASYRLAFRELGLSIGLHAVDMLRRLIDENPNHFKNKQQLHSLIQNLIRHAAFRQTIEKFWLDPANRKARSWTEHREINMVMLATSLAPDGYLAL
jgi:hypothetical protein